MKSYTINVEGVGVHITESIPTNSGPDDIVLIFLHGLSMDSRVWMHQLNAPVLSAYRKIAIDLPGHGRSGWSPEPLSGYSLNAIGNTIQRVINAMQIKNFILIGSSLGANIALHSLPCLDGCKGILAITVPLSKPLDTSVFIDPDFLLTKVYQEVMSNDTIERFGRLLFRPTAQVPTFVEDAVTISDPKFRSALMAFIGQGNYDDEWDLIHRCPDIPVSLVIGALDQFYDFNYLQKMDTSSVWKGAVQWISNAGHLPQWNNPDGFNKVLLDFIEDVR